MSDVSRKFTNFELSPGVAAFVRAGADEFRACHMLIYSSDVSQYLLKEWMISENQQKDCQSLNTWGAPVGAAPGRRLSSVPAVPALHSAQCTWPQHNEESLCQRYLRSGFGAKAKTEIEQNCQVTRGKVDQLVLVAWPILRAQTCPRFVWQPCTSPSPWPHQGFLPFFPWIRTSIHT